MDWFTEFICSFRIVFSIVYINRTIFLIAWAPVQPHIETFRVARQRTIQSKIFSWKFICLLRVVHDILCRKKETVDKQQVNIVMGSEQLSALLIKKYVEEKYKIKEGNGLRLFLNILPHILFNPMIIYIMT